MLTSLFNHLYLTIEVRTQAQKSSCYQVDSILKIHTSEECSQMPSPSQDLPHLN